MTRPPTAESVAHQPRRGDLMRSFLYGASYLVFLASLISFVTKTPLGLTLLGVFLTVTTVFVILLVLAVRIAESDRPGRQMRLSSLFLVIAVAAIYLGIVRWLAVATVANPSQLDLGRWSAVFVASLLFIVISIPFVLHLGEALMWSAVWLVWRPTVQHLLRRWRRRRSRD